MTFANPALLGINMTDTARQLSRQISHVEFEEKLCKVFAAFVGC
jgi:hypothetical protein